MPRPEDELNVIDIGHDHWLKYTRWAPDRDLNPQYADLPDVEKVGAIVWHPDLKEPGKMCCSGIHFRGPVQEKLFNDKSMWVVESWEPLTVSPSLLCMRCGDHGFIRNGKWEPC